jgi:hypothetical protein
MDIRKNEDPKAKEISYFRYKATNKFGVKGTFAGLVYCSDEKTVSVMKDLQKEWVENVFHKKICVYGGNYRWTLSKQKMFYSYSSR